MFCSLLRTFSAAFISISIIICLCLVMVDSSIAASGLGYKVRITGFAVFDTGSPGGGGEAGASIDVVQDECGTAGEEEPEDFYDTYLGITVKNSSILPVFIRRFSFRLRNSDGAGKRYRSRRFAVLGNNEIGVNQSVQILGFLLNVKEGRKYLPGNSSPVPEALGIRNIRIRVFGKNSARKRIRLRGMTAVVFRNVNRC